MLSTLVIAALVVFAPPPDEAWWPEDLSPRVATPLEETAEQHDQRMAWWREARFGMFIHWGLYAIPGGHWDGKRTGGAEWILNAVRIHPEEYMPLADSFNPIEFNADEWAKVARDAGMRYVVITSKHHDGFCLWPSAFTEFDIESTPFKRDIMGELAQACRAEGLVFCMYHSIMDWTHLDYFPPRAWDDRSRDGHEYSAYVEYMQNQLGELIEHYGPGVLWFDGEWEGTWTHEHGQKLYDHVRTLDPRIIINNRVDTGRSGMAGLTREGGYRGDYGTPEQEIPASGMPRGVDWETCMTMNRSWGYQSFDTAFKSTKDLVHKLVDIASKGGNFLLNVGPDSKGKFPPESIERLKGIGAWMDENGESIHGTFASPFGPLPWGRCTRRTLPNGNERLYLHVFDRPATGDLLLPGLMNAPLGKGASVLTGSTHSVLRVRRDGASLAVALPARLPNTIDTVIVLDIKGEATVVGPPTMSPSTETIFVDTVNVTLSSPSNTIAIRYELDGAAPTSTSPLYSGDVVLRDTTALAAACFLGDRIVSGITYGSFKKVKPKHPVHLLQKRPGLTRRAYLGSFDVVPEFRTLTAASETTVPTLTIEPQPRDEHFAMHFAGFIEAPTTGIYTFWLDSDDGSVLLIGGEIVIDNDGLHSANELTGTVALEAGLHPLSLGYFENTGQDDLIVKWSGPSFVKVLIEKSAFFH
jgi:alpha-L-fucosidase